MEAKILPFKRELSPEMKASIIQRLADHTTKICDINKQMVDLDIEKQLLQSERERLNKLVNGGME